MQLFATFRPELVPLFTGLSVPQFERLVEAVARRSGDTVADGRPAGRGRCRWPTGCCRWRSNYRTNRTMRRLASLFGVKQAAVHRIIDRAGRRASARIS